MSKKHKHDLETRVQIVKEYQSGQISLIQIGKKYGLRGETVRRMVKRYETEGTEGLRNLLYLGRKELHSKNLLPWCLHRYLRFRKTMLTSLPKAGMPLIFCSR